MSNPGVPLQSAQNPAPQPDEDLLAALGLHPAQLQVAHGLASGAIHPQQVIDAVTPPPPLAAAENPGVNPPAAPVAGAVPEKPQSPAVAPIAPAPSLSGVKSTPRIAQAFPDDVQAPTRLTEDQAKLQHDTSTGSGIQQFQQRHPILGGFARVGAGIGSAVFPGIAANIPGTDLHHEVVLNQDRRAVGEDLGEQEKGAQIGEAQARTPLIQAQTREANANAAAKENPQDKATKPEPIFDKAGNIVGFNTGTDLIGLNNPKLTPDMKAIAEAAKPKEEKTPNDFEQYYHDFLTENKFPDTAHNRLLARERFAAAGAVPQKPQQELIEVPVDSNDASKGVRLVEAKPGMILPAGAKKAGTAEKGPTADEQRRADLADNMNENLDQLEDILTRRPDLFGPVAGRLTGLRETVGTSDPDVAALKTIEEQVGMAMVGAHAMRNANHVETAARSITNSLHNSPDAVKQAITTARKSLATFQQDVGKQPGTQAKGGGATQSFTDNGVTYNIPADKVAAFKKDHPNAQ